MATVGKVNATIVVRIEDFERLAAANDCREIT